MFVSIATIMVREMKVHTMDKEEWLRKTVMFHRGEMVIFHRHKNVMEMEMQVEEIFHVREECRKQELLPDAFLLIKDLEKIIRVQIREEVNLHIRILHR